MYSLLTKRPCTVGIVVDESLFSVLNKLIVVYLKSVTELNHKMGLYGITVAQK